MMVSPRLAQAITDSLHPTLKQGLAVLELLTMDQTGLWDHEALRG